MHKITLGDDINLSHPLTFGGLHAGHELTRRKSSRLAPKQLELTSPLFTYNVYGLDLRTTNNCEG
jgi:hypothetical protein